MTHRRASLPRGYRAVALGAALLVGLCPWRSAQCAQPEIYSEAAVKAVFLYRFADYVQWPPDALAARKFTIAVLGADEVATRLEELLPNHAILGLPAQVKQISEVRQIGDAQTLYIGRNYRGSLRAVIAALRDRPVLVVSDVVGGLDAGSAVNFVLSDQHVRFEISTVAASRARLKISAEMLAIASRIKAAYVPHVGCRTRFWAQGRAALCLTQVSRG